MGNANLKLVLGCDAGVDTSANVFTGPNIDGNVVEESIEQIGGAKMGRVDEIVGAFWVFLQPETLVGSVVQHNIADAQNLSIIDCSFWFTLTKKKSTKLTFHSLRNF